MARKKIKRHQKRSGLKLRLGRQRTSKKKVKSNPVKKCKKRASKRRLCRKKRIFRLSKRNKRAGQCRKKKKHTGKKLVKKIHRKKRLPKQNNPRPVVRKRKYHIAQLHDFTRLIDENRCQDLAILNSFGQVDCAKSWQCGYIFLDRLDMSIDHFMEAMKHAIKKGHSRCLQILVNAFLDDDISCEAKINSLLKLTDFHNFHRCREVIVLALAKLAVEVFDNIEIWYALPRVLNFCSTVHYNAVVNFDQDLGTEFLDRIVVGDQFAEEMKSHLKLITDSHFTVKEQLIEKMMIKSYDPVFGTPATVDTSYIWMLIADYIGICFDKNCKLNYVCNCVGEY